MPSDYLDPTQIPPSLAFLVTDTTKQLDAAFQSAERTVADKTADLLEALKGLTPEHMTLPEARAAFAAMRDTVAAQIEADSREFRLLEGIVATVDAQIAAAVENEAVTSAS